MTKSQDEIRRLVTLGAPRIWPLYGKRILEWKEVQARSAARQLVNSVGSTEASDPVSAVHPDDSSKSESEPKQARINETPEEREFLQKTLGAIRHILGELGEISSKRLACELVQIEGGPWAQWGRGREKKPITQNALARLLRPHNVVPVDVGPEHARRKGYKRAQFEHLFQSLPRTSPWMPSYQPSSRAEGDAGEHA